MQPFKNAFIRGIKLGCLARNEAYYYDSNGQPQRVSYFQCFQYMFAHHNVVMAIGVFCAVIGCALFGFWAYHMYLIWCGTTTNETFKWGDLKELRQVQEAKRLHAEGALLFAPVWCPSVCPRPRARV